MGATRVGRLDAAGPRLGRADRSQTRNIFRKVIRALAGAPLLWAIGALCVLGIAFEQVRTLAFRAPALVAGSVIMVAALRRERAIRRGIADAATAEERRRIARDLHDGLAQDLAFIASHGSRISQEAGEDHPIAIAARRALAVSRGAIADLSAADAPTANAALRQVADELQVRFPVRVCVEADETELSGATREDVVRIAREAMINAANGEARNIVVSLSRRGQVIVLRVLDDGVGIEGGDVKARPGFGLRAMHERADALGGGLTARVIPGGGTELEVVFP
jgi:signal transduction histidine kinase